MTIRLTLLAAAVLFSTLAGAVSIISAERKPGKPVGIPGYTTIEDEEYKALPNPENSPEDAAELGCSACALAVQLMQRQLEKLKTEFQRQPQNLKEYHALAAIDGLCNKYGLKVGLISYEDKSVAKKFVHESDGVAMGAKTVLKGGWITRFWMMKCEDMMTDAEDHLSAMMKGKQIDLCPMCKDAQMYEERRNKKKQAAEERKNKKQRAAAGGDL